MGVGRRGVIFWGVCLWLFGLFLLVDFGVYYFKVMSQASVAASEQLICNTSNAIIPIFSRSVYSTLFPENRVNWCVFLSSFSS